MVFSNLKGFFFYQFIVRKDLLNKFLGCSVLSLPAITDIRFSVSTNQKLKENSLAEIFSWICLLEMVTGESVNLRLTDVLQLTHVTAVRNFKLCVDLFGFKVYDFFFNVFFLWFKGLSFPSEDFKTSLLVGKKNQKVKGFKLSRSKDFVKVFYLKYVEPKIKPNIKLSSVVLSYWSDFTFCVFIPINITDMCLDVGFKIQFVFNTKFNKEKLLLLSGLRVLHRFGDFKKLIK